MIYPDKKILPPVLAVLALLFAAAVFIFSKNNFEPEENLDTGLFQSQNQSDSGESQTLQVQDAAIEEPEEQKGDDLPESSYPLHRDITASVFWVGEKASEDNEEISNKSSAWDSSWKKNFGGTDDPEKRNAFYPKKFVPKENPFYLALPYNDFDTNGNRRENSSKIPWAGEKNWEKNESMVKNRWVKIIHDGKSCFGQWEDVGPFKENDFDYVFGNKGPKSEINKNAGIDVSPALRDCLALDDLDNVDWQFVDFEDVPDGPWKNIITTSQVSWL